MNARTKWSYEFLGSAGTFLESRLRWETVTEFSHLRPLERRVCRLAESGVVPDEIGRRFKRSGTHIEQVLLLSGLPDRNAPQLHEDLTPLERRLIRWRDQGAPTAEVAARFRRGPDNIERVLALADYKQQQPNE